MLAASHALTGAIIAVAAPHPLIGYGIALASHPLLDFIPHWDLHTRYRHRSKANIILLSLADAAFGIIPGLLLFQNQVPFSTLFATMIIAQGPDWLEAPYHIFDWHFPPFSTIKKLQHIWHHKLELPWGLVIQIAFILGSFYILSASGIYPN